MIDVLAVGEDGWAKELNNAIADGKTGPDLPRIEIRAVIFKGTYDEHNWKVLQERWDDLRAQLHGEAIADDTHETWELVQHLSN